MRARPSIARRCWLASSTAPVSWRQTDAPKHWVFTIFYGPLLVLEAYIVFCVRSCRRALFPTSPLFAPSGVTGGKEISSLPVPEGALVLREEASTVELPTHEPAILSRQRALYAQLAGYPYILLLTWAVGTFRRCASVRWPASPAISYM